MEMTIEGNLQIKVEKIDNGVNVKLIVLDRIALRPMFVMGPFAVPFGESLIVQGADFRVPFTLGASVIKPTPIHLIEEHEV